jgi:hypothetical protein
MLSRLVMLKKSQRAVTSCDSLQIRNLYTSNLELTLLDPIELSLPFVDEPCHQQNWSIFNFLSIFPVKFEEILKRITKYFCLESIR